MSSRSRGAGAFLNKGASTSTEEVPKDTKEDLEADDENDADTGEEEPGIAFDEKLYGKLLEEVDPFVFEETFCVISKKFDKHYISRYSCSSSLYLFGPLNPIRKLAIYITTHPWFDYIIIITIIANCVTLALQGNRFMENGPGNFTKKLDEWEEPLNKVEYGFLAIYSLEMFLKIIAKGFAFNKFSYLRNGWNRLDFIVVLEGYIQIIMDHVINRKNGVISLEVLRTLRVLRAIKTISILPGLRTMINALLSSLVQLLEVMLLTVFCLCIFSLFAMEVYMGRLRHRCVKDLPGPILTDTGEVPPEAEISYIWLAHVDDPNNWKKRDFPRVEFIVCANDSGTRPCPEGFTCLPMRGENPDFGWTGFDNFFFSMLTTFQLMTLDFWERIYELVLSCSGYFSLLFFGLVIFLGSYCLLNLMLAVVTMSYENEVSKPEQIELTKNQKLALVRTRSTFSFEDLSHLNITEMTTYHKVPASERELIARRLRRKSVPDEEEEQGQKLANIFMQILGKRRSVPTEQLSRELKQLKRLQEDEKEKLSADHRNKQSHGGEITTIKEPKTTEKGPVDKKEEKKIDGGDGIKGDEVSLRSVDSDWDSLDEDDDEDERGHLFQRNLKRLGFILRTKLQPIVNHIVFEIFILLCIVANTVILAMERHDQSKEERDNLEWGNVALLVIFALEAILKILALQWDYFRSGWNCFDLFFVTMSFVELLLKVINLSFSVIRSTRVLRVFKLAQTWITMKVLLNIIFSTFGALANLSLVLLIVIFIFSVAGMQIVGEDYNPKAFCDRGPGGLDDEEHCDYPSWHFGNFGYSFMMVFRILCGEWIEALWDCLRAQELNGYYFKCFMIFLPVLIVGNFIVLNLFLALLLNSFNTEELKAQRDKELEAKKKVDNLKNIVGMLLLKKEKSSSKKGTHPEIPEKAAEEKTTSSV